MFKKFLVVFCLLNLLLSPLSVFAQEASPSPTPTEEEEYDFASMTTYELFWPIVAGKVPGDRFYTLKLWRDKLVGYLFFSKLKKSEYFKQLANKRLIEAEKLLELQRYPPFPETVKRANEYLERGLELLASGELTSQALWLREEYKKDIQKHIVVLKRMAQVAREEEKAAIEESLKNIDELIEEHKLEIAP